MHALSYPIGPFVPIEDVSPAQRARWMTDLEATPGWLADAVAGLTDAQLDTPYRPGGWTVRQVVHHIADSQLNGYIRFKWALTETTPTIKTYDQERWAALPEARQAPIAPSMALLEALIHRWLLGLHAMTDDDFARTLYHPETGPAHLGTLLGLYAWHGRHHIAHITGLRAREGW